MKHKPKTIRLKDGERIVAVVPEKCSGPGWSNRPVWVHIVNRSGKYREECIQPNEQTPNMSAIFRIGLEVCNALVNSVPVERS